MLIFTHFACQSCQVVFSLPEPHTAPGRHRNCVAGLIVVALRVWCQGVATVIEIVAAAAAALRAVQIRNFENSLNNALLDV